jgi:hypothetical protein
VECTQTKYTDYINELKDVRKFPENDNAAGAHRTYAHASSMASLSAVV